jgi:hypothetical protein
MGSNIGKNAGTTAVDSLKPNLKKMDQNIEKGLEEISEFKKSMDKNVDLLLNKMDQVFNELNSLADDTLLQIDGLIQNYMSQMIILTQIIFICAIIYKFCIIQLKNQKRPSLISSLVSMNHFAILVILFLSIHLKFIYDGKTEIYPITIPFWLWSIFLLIVTILDWLMKVIFDENTMQASQHTKSRTTFIIVLALFFIYLLHPIINRLREEYGI